MSKVSRLLASAAVALICTGVSASAQVVVHRAHVVRHVVRARVVAVPRRVILVRRPAVRIVGPAKYVPLGPDEFVDPANPGYVHGVDDGSRFDSAADGIAAGREEPDPGPRDLGIRPVSSYPAPGYEIEGPPISPTLPVVPELVDRSLY